jgi:hypothetical protein
MLFAEDIARLRSISRWQARRWLAQLEENHGADVVGCFPGRRGVRRYTSEAALAKIGPPVDGEDVMMTNVLSRLERLEKSA